MKRGRVPHRDLVRACLLAMAFAAVHDSGLAAGKTNPRAECEKLRLAVQDIAETFGDAYAEADSYLKRLAGIESRLENRDPHALQDLERLRSEALLANPLVTQLPGVLLVKRKPKDLDRENVLTPRDHHIGFSAGLGREVGMPSNHECNASLEADRSSIRPSDLVVRIADVIIRGTGFSTSVFASSATMGNLMQIGSTTCRWIRSRYGGVRPSRPYDLGVFQFSLPRFPLRGTRSPTLSSDLSSAASHRRC